MYGKKFRKYVLAKKEHYFKSKKQGVWVWLGILTQLILVFLGFLLLPPNHQTVWSAIVLVCLTLILSLLLSLCREFWRFSNFKRWAKHEKKHKASDDKIL